MQYLGDLGCEHIVFKNDEKTIDELRALKPRGILLSPGPGTMNAGCATQLIDSALLKVFASHHISPACVVHKTSVLMAVNVRW